MMDRLPPLPVWTQPNRISLPKNNNGYSYGKWFVYTILFLVFGFIVLHIRYNFRYPDHQIEILRRYPHPMLIDSSYKRSWRVTRPLIIDQHWYQNRICDVFTHRVGAR